MKHDLTVRAFVARLEKLTSEQFAAFSKAVREADRLAKKR